MHPTAVRANGRGQTAWLRIYLGYAPGVGKTYAMLQEGRRRRSRGTDVVVGWVQAYDRPRTLEAIGDLEIVPPRRITHRGVAVDEMDIDAVLARRPQVVLVDELAHTNVIGSRHQKRYQDVLELQACDVSVVSTMNIQHLVSLQDTLRLVTGVTVSETLPDWVLDSADELEIIDQSPEALLKRMRHGNVFPREQVERALEGYFRTDTLASLRELTLRRVADHTQRKLQTSEPDNNPVAPPRNETILVCLPPSSGAAALLTRGVHLAEQLRARLVVLHVTQPSRGLHLEAQRGHQEAMKALQLARALGAEVHTRHASNVAEAVIQFAVEVGATQLVLGESTRSWLRELVQGSVMREVLRRTRDVDVHVVRRSEP